MRQRHPVGPARVGRRRKLAAAPGVAILLVAGLAGISNAVGAQEDEFPIDPGGIIEVVLPGVEVGELPPPDPDPPVGLPQLDPDPATDEPVLEPDPAADDPLFDVDPGTDEPVLDVDPPGQEPPGDGPPIDEPPVLDVDPPVQVPPAVGGIAVTVDADTAAVPETGAEVVFTVSVENQSEEAVELDRLVDDRFGNLNGSGTCAIDVLIGPGETYTCETTEDITGPTGSDHVNTVTATATLAEQQRQVTANGEASVAIIDLTPSITLDYSVSRDWVIAPGENVTFTVRITNESAATDPVTIDSMVDSVQGSLHQVGTCVTSRIIAPGRTTTCIFTIPVDQDDYAAQLVVTATDDDGTVAEASAEVAVDMSAPAASLEVTLGDEDADEAPGPFVIVGQSVELVYTVRNDGDVPLGDVRVLDNAGMPVSCPAGDLEPGATMSCTDSVTAEAGPNAHEGTLRASWTAPNRDKVWQESSDAVNFFGAEPSVTLTVGPDLQAAPLGGDAAFTVTVTNTGNVELTEVAALSQNLAGCSQNLDDLAPGETVTYECTSGPVDAAIDGEIALVATPPTGEPITAGGNARVILPLGRIVTPETSCADILAGAGDDLSELGYTLGRSNRILSIRPALFSYYAVITVNTAGVVTVDQVDDGSTPAFDTYRTTQTLLLKPDCTRAQLGRSPQGSGTVTFAGVTPGTYIVSVTYTPDAARGALTPGVVTYRFTTSIAGEPLASTEATMLLGPR